MLYLIFSTTKSLFNQQSHRGSSPQIRTFAPDGRTTSSSALHHLHAAQSSDPSSSIPGNNSCSGISGNSRSPSPASCHRAASLDNRCSSPGGASSTYCGSTGDLRTPSPSQSSLVSLTDRGSASSACNSPIPPPSPRGTSISRCLSPLLIPPPASRSLVSEPAAPPASPLGALQPDLYQRRDGPLFLGSRRSGPSLGRLHLRLKYDFDRSDLHVHLIEGEYFYCNKNKNTSFQVVLPYATPICGTNINILLIFCMPHFTYCFYYYYYYY